MKGLLIDEQSTTPWSLQNVFNFNDVKRYFALLKEIKQPISDLPLASFSNIYLIICIKMSLICMQMKTYLVIREKKWRKAIMFHFLQSVVEQQNQDFAAKDVSSPDFIKETVSDV